MPPGSLFPLFSGSPDARSAVLQNLLIAAILVTGLYVGREVLLPLAMAVLLAFVLTPPLLLLRRLHVPRVIGVTILVTATFAAILGLGWLISQQVSELAETLPTYQYTLSEKVSSIRKAAAQSPAMKRAADTLKELQEQLAQPATQDDGSESAAAGESEPKPIPVTVIGGKEGVLDLYQDAAGTLLPPLATAAIVLLFLIFILMQREDLRDRAIKLLGSSDLQRTTHAMNDAAHRLSQYFLRQVVINTAYGIFIGLGLWLIGVPSPAVWGILAAMMRFVPYIGSYIAAGFPLILAAAVDPGWSTFFIVLALFLVSEPVMGQIVEPLVYGRGTGLSPIAVVASTIFWTWLWGPLGLLLAMPITVCLMVLGRHVEGLSFFEVLLGDKPALTPAQSFYQRALTGDAAEATLQAELCLKDQSLQSYLDEVAVKGLQYAQDDAERGALDTAEMTRIGETVKEVVGNLSHFAPRRWFAVLRRMGQGGGEEAEREAAAAEEDEGLAHLLAMEEGDTGDDDAGDLPIVNPEDLAPSWRSEGSVLCIGGRTPLDEAAALMLAELLRKRGLKAQSLGPETIAAGNITSLAQSGAQLLCLSYIGLDSTPAHYRYLVMRLRRILPKGCRILVGAWVAEDEADTRALNELRAAAGADAYAIRLGEAADLCVEMAKEAGAPATKTGKPAAKLAAETA